MGDSAKPMEMQRNIVAGAVMEASGFVPLTVRYRAADAALSVVREWQENVDNGPDIDGPR